MKVFIKIKFLLIVSLLLGFNTGFSQASFTITDENPGNAGSADVIIAQARASATAGNNVIVYMDAPGLCNVTQTILLNHNAGSITIDKHPDAQVEQGFVLGSSSSINIAFNVTAITNNSNVTVKNIKIKNMRSAFRIDGGNKFVFDQVIFENYNEAITLGSGINDIANEVEILNCTFSNPVPPVGASSFYMVKRDNSQFINSPPSSNNHFYFKQNTIINSGNQYSILNILTSAETDQLDVQIDHNLSDPFMINVGSAINQPSDYLFRVNISNNNLLGPCGLLRPCSDWVFNNNNLDVANQFEYLNVTYSAHSVNDFNMINSSPVFINNNNTFTPNPYPINPSNVLFGIFEGNNEQNNNIEITGLDLPATISKSKNISIRKCKIHGTGLDLPILSDYEPQLGFTAQIDMSDPLQPILQGQYTFSNLLGSEIEDGKYIDFYKTNANGDLLDYLGSKHIPIGSSLQNGVNYNYSLLIPQGVTLNATERIAATVTSLQGQSYNVYLGTSIGYYSTVTELSCCKLIAIGADLEAIFSGLDCGSASILAIGGNPNFPPRGGGGGGVLIGYNGSVCMGKTVTYDFTSLKCDEFMSFTVDFGDGTPPVHNPSAIYTHIYAAVGNYHSTVTISSSNNTDCNQVFPCEVHVIDNCCPAQTDFNIEIRTEDPNMCIGQSYNMQLTSSNASCLLTSLFESVNWTFSNGATEAGYSAFQSFSTPGTYTATVVLTSSTCGSYTVTKVFSVVDCNPTCCIPDFTNTISGLHSPCSPIFIPFSDKLYIGYTSGGTCVGSEITFDISNFVCPAGNIMNYTIDFGDNTPQVTGVTTATHIYTAPGMYYMFVNFQDINNPSCNRSGQNYLYAINVLPNCCPTSPLNISSYIPESTQPFCAPAQVAFSINDDNDCWLGNFTSHANWTISNGDTFTGDVFNYTFTTPGTYTITATAEFPTCGIITYTTTMIIPSCVAPCEDCFAEFETAYSCNNARSEAGCGNHIVYISDAAYQNRTNIIFDYNLSLRDQNQNSVLITQVTDGANTTFNTNYTPDNHPNFTYVGSITIPSLLTSAGTDQIIHAYRFVHPPVSFTTGNISVFNFKVYEFNSGHTTSSHLSAFDSEMYQRKCSDCSKCPSRMLMVDLDKSYSAITYGFGVQPPGGGNPGSPSYNAFQTVKSKMYAFDMGMENALPPVADYNDVTDLSEIGNVEEVPASICQNAQSAEVRCACYSDVVSKLMELAEMVRTSGSLLTDLNNYKKNLFYDGCSCLNKYCLQFNVPDGTTIPVISITLYPYLQTGLPAYSMVIVKDLNDPSVFHYKICYSDFYSGSLEDGVLVDGQLNLACNVHFESVDLTTISDYKACMINCPECITDFAPLPGQKYMVSAWVKEENANNTSTYVNPQLIIEELDGANNVLAFQVFSASGKVIDNWQKIDGEYLIGAGTTKIRIRLKSLSGNSFFDDIRFFPYNGSMKSYVYDPITLRLSAELDERNYATIYEYDEEGKLVRVKKETEKGIMTIQENRSNTKKK